MTRTRRRKILYVGSLLALGIAVYGSLYWLRAPPWAWALSIVLLLVPGRIAGLYYRDFFTGRRLMGARRYADALACFERFLTQVRARPGLKRLIWLHAGIYTRDIEAMALNNIGACHLELNALDRVSEPLQMALAIDPEYPIPHLNFAQLAARRGDQDAARVAAVKASDLGYRDSWLDALIRRGSAALAGLEGRRRL